MGPRRVVAKRRHPTAPATMERRTKQRNDNQAPPILEVPVPPRVSMASRSVIVGKKIYFNFLEEENFRIGDWIKAQGWELFSSLDLPVYPTLVRAFFENMTLGANEIYSTVKGCNIVVDQGIISNLLNMPSEGIQSLHLTKRLEGMRTILERRDVKKNFQYSSQPTFCGNEIIAQHGWESFLSKNR